MDETEIYSSLASRLHNYKKLFSLLRRPIELHNCLRVPTSKAIGKPYKTEIRKKVK